MDHRSSLFFSVTLGFLAPSAAALLEYFKKRISEIISSLTPPKPKKATFKLLKLPWVALKEVLRPMEHRDVFMLSLCSKKTSNILKTWKTKVSWLVYIDRDCDLSVYSIQNNYHRDLIFSMRYTYDNKYWVENEQDLIRLTIGGMDVQCLWKGDGIEYYYTTNSEALQQALDNHNHQLFTAHNRIRVIRKDTNRHTDRPDKIKLPEYPSIQARERLNEVCQFIVPRQSNTMVVPGYGQIPVVKGDLSCLSPEVSVFLNECVQLMTPSTIRICNGSVFEAQELRDSIGNEFGSEEQKVLDRLHFKMNDIGFDDIHVITKDRMDADPGTFSSTTTSSTNIHVSKSTSTDNMENVRLSSHYMTGKHFDFAKEKRFDGCMSGRTMYVVPFSMGWIGSRHSVVGVQITDDPILVLNLRCTFRVLPSVWDCIASTTNFIRSVHSIGMPRPIIRRIVFPSPPEPPVGSFIVLKHDEQQVWAHGYPFGRTPRFGKTFSIHAASWIGAKRGWLAEQAAILAITNPKNETINVCYSSMTPVESLQLSAGLANGWKIDVICEKSVWIHWHNGKMHAFSPENDEMEEMGTQKNLSNLLSGSIQDYQIQGFNPQKTKWERDVGVPISAYIFANRRHDQYPLILEANTWEEGVCLAAGIRVAMPKKSGSLEGTSATDQTQQQLVECPMLRPDSINFSFAKYVNHWLEMGIGVKTPSAESSESYDSPVPPQIFLTNLYQEADGKVIWPGGVDNAKVFEYIYGRCTNPSDTSNTVSSGVGKVPKNLELSALVNLPPLLQINIRFWLTELNKLRSFFNAQMECCLPPQLDKVLTDLAGNL